MLHSFSTTDSRESKRSRRVLGCHKQQRASLALAGPLRSFSNVAHLLLLIMQIYTCIYANDYVQSTGWLSHTNDTNIDIPNGLETKCWSKLNLDTSVIGCFTNRILHVNNNRSKLYRGYALVCNNSSLICGILK